jgi:predicted metal-dependent phosphoesterase TrpH
MDRQVSIHQSSISIDFHVHTSFSYDCLMPPKFVIEAARRKGLDGIAVTDHDTVEGALATVAANKHSDFLVIPGIEVKSELGDIIGLYVTSGIASRRFTDVIREIHEQGGVAYLPHPIRTFGATRLDQIHAAHPEIDLWELYNGRYQRRDFCQADDAFAALNIEGPLCGSDAHFPWEIGVFRALLTDLPRDSQSLMALSRSAKLQADARGDLDLSTSITLGAMTKAFKRGEHAKLARTITKLPWKVLKKGVRAGLDRFLC